jgi:hypothetical protein
MQMVEETTRELLAPPWYIYLPAVEELHVGPILSSRSEGEGVGGGCCCWWWCLVVVVVVVVVEGWWCVEGGPIVFQPLTLHVACSWLQGACWVSLDVSLAGVLG